MPQMKYVPLSEHVTFKADNDLRHQIRLVIRLVSCVDFSKILRPRSEVPTIPTNNLSSPSIALAIDS